MKRLDKKVAMVTGGASGLGKAIAQRLAAEGARVIITDVQVDLGEQLASSGGFGFIQQDVTVEKQWSSIIQYVEERYGMLSILVNNAGILGSTSGSDPEHATLESWKKIFAVNAEGVFLGCRAAIPAMRRAGTGSIINVSSVAALLATPDAAAYGASKAAVRQLTKSVAQYCAAQKLGIRCNSVHPGNVRTPLLELDLNEAAQRRGVPIAQVIDEYKAIVPLGDFTLAEDIAAAVAFLASEDARHITGSKIVVDGGIVHCDTFRIGMAERGGDAMSAREPMP